mgnify:CR=1 FL=1
MGRLIHAHHANDWLPFPHAQLSQRDPLNPAGHCAAASARRQLAGDALAVPTGCQVRLLRRERCGDPGQPVGEGVDVSSAASKEFL